ncbi:aluminum-activated malate transporter 2-like [Pyrus communis]|uniref:aluminum-activated malate transporter 2-like n=1 Tax=Pyrus communis TaxID=23211 RepID=UPI0035C0165D
MPSPAVRDQDNHNDTENSSMGYCGKVMNKVVEFPRKLKKLGQDDPRRIVHSLKVGLAVLLVSLLYYFQPFYNGLGDTAMWAILTVVVVFEFSVGATLGRGLNRILATFLAGALGFGVHHLANLSGDIAHPILIGIFVFLLAASVTFIRFFPRMKARYDYGLLIFILTFCLISVSGYRDEEILEMAHKRASTILIGAFIAVFVCVFICPVWAGDDLHNSVAKNIEKLGSFLEGFGDECFKVAGSGESNMAHLQGYSSVLNSKQSEETQANFARWEPRHGKFRYRHPWRYYLKIGNLTRQCAYRIDTLSGYLNSEVQTPLNIQNNQVQELCMKMSSESGKALKELAWALKTMTEPCSAASSHITKSRAAANNLESMLRTNAAAVAGVGGDQVRLLDIVPAVTVASLLSDVVAYAEQIEKSIQKLASFQHVQFKSAERKKPTALTSSKTSSSNVGPHHVITMDRLASLQVQESSKEIGSKFQRIRSAV